MLNWWIIFTAHFASSVCLGIFTWAITNSKWYRKWVYKFSMKWVEESMKDI